MEEQQDLLQEMNEAISQPIGFMSTVDDDELLDELDDIEAKEYEAGMLDIDAPAQQLPQQRVPEQRVQAPAQAADELDAMFNEMQMS